MDGALNLIRRRIEDSIYIKTQILGDQILHDNIFLAYRMMGACIRGGGHIFFAGNGGNAADAQHFAAEFVSRFLFDRPGLSASSLSTDTSILTAIGNEYGFEKIFSRQLQAKAKKGDIFFAISTSGKSQNILHGLEFCESNKI